MVLFKNKRKCKVMIQEGTGELVYQYKTGEYLPDSQQPSPIDSSIYLPHKSTRYKNVIIGKGGIAKILWKNGDRVKMLDTEKQLPELYKDRQWCCGCTACYAICSVNAITMEPDEEGFDYPVVDAGRCIRCCKCESVCPIKKKLKEKEENGL